MATRYAELVGKLRKRADQAGMILTDPPQPTAKNALLTEAAAAITALEARCERLEECLRQLLGCEYDGIGLRDCTDNYGVPYQSAALAARIADGERLLASIESKP